MCGPSSGANYLGALHYLRDNLPKIEGNVTAVFLACDRVEWYYSYIRERAPEIFRETPRPASFAAFDFNPFQGAPAIQPDQLESWMAENKPLIIDVRSKIAFNLGHLRDSMNIPQPIFESMIDEARPFTEDRPILLVCAVGEKTKKHAAYLVKQGYRAFSLDKGMRGIKTPGRSAPPRPAVGA
jgi:cysteine synthase B